ncbi:MAG: hypothetical protein IT307_13050, partial [Chloroflexi bacterium]|nr:hypothetical protein [Chloroflexota bacterium]
VNYNVVIAVDPTAAKLLPGMTATVNVIVDQRDDVVVVPTSAIAYGSSQVVGSQSSSATQSTDSDPGAATVVVLRNSIPVAVRVQVGASDGPNTEITSGLQPGDVVATGQSGGQMTTSRAASSNVSRAAAR